MRAVLPWLAVASLAGCSHRWNQVGLGAALAVTTCDEAQTANAMRRPDFVETNPILGQHPSQTEIRLYGAGVLTAMVAAWVITPEKFRPALLTGLLAIEGSVVFENAMWGARGCGL